MTDISLSVGLETKNARDEALALAKTLDEIEKIGKRLEKMESPFKKGIKDISNTTKATKEYISSVDKLLNKHDKYGAQLKELNAEKKLLLKAQKEDTANTARYNRALAQLESKLKKVRAETNTGAKAAKELAAARREEAAAAEKLKKAEGNAYLKSANQRIKQHKELMAIRAKADTDEKRAIAEKERAYKKLLNDRLKQHQTIMRVREISDRNALKAIRDRLKEHQKEMAVKAKIAATGGMPTLASGGSGRGTKEIDGHSNALERNSRAAFRAASANKANNAILSDQIGFWRFAGRAAALYFSSLATDRLLSVNLELQALEKSLEVIGGSQQAGAESMAFITDEAERLGLEIGSLAQGYKLFSASTKDTTLEGALTRDIFSSVAEAASAMKLSVADTDGVMRALSQIMSKGKVSSEELRQQLGDRLRFLTLWLVTVIEKLA